MIHSELYLVLLSRHYLDSSSNERKKLTQKLIFTVEQKWPSFSVFEQFEKKLMRKAEKLIYQSISVF